MYTMHRLSPGIRWKRIGSAVGSVLLFTGSIASGAESSSPESLITKLDQVQLKTIERMVLAHPEVQSCLHGSTPRVIVGEPEVDKGEAQAYLTNERREPPTTIVRVLILDAEGKVARRVTVGPNQGRVLSVEMISPALVPFGSEDVQAAWNLASRDPAVREALGSDADRFRLASPDGSAGESFIIEALPLRSIDPNDPCSQNRCLDLIFRGKDSSYLPMRVAVDLTQRTAAIEGRKPQ